MTDELNDDMYEPDGRGGVVIKREDTYIIAGKLVHLNAEIHEYCEKETLGAMQYILDSNAQKIARPDWDYSQVITIMDYIKEHLAHIESKMKKAGYAEYDGIGVDYEKVKLIKGFFLKIGGYFAVELRSFREKTEKMVQDLEAATGIYLERLKEIIWGRAKCDANAEEE